MDSAYLSQVSTMDGLENTGGLLSDTLAIPSKSRRASMSEPIDPAELKKNLYQSKSTVSHHKLV